MKRLLLLLMCAAVPVGGCDGDDRARELPSGWVSEFGRYSGFTAPLYSEWVRTSRYVEVSDGTALAIDITRPTMNGAPVEKPLPVVWTLQSYGRRLSAVERNPDREALVRHGYVVVAVDTRGTGASYGQQMEYSDREARDAFEITEWLASQPWCDGNVGMLGQSYLGIVQLLAAGHNPPHLKAVFPSMVGFDLYDLVFPGGVYRGPPIDRLWQGFIRRSLEATGPPVDDDSTGVRLVEASDTRRERQGTPQDTPYRDSQLGDSPVALFTIPERALAGINDAQVPVYLWAGWFDVYGRDPFVWFANLTGPKKLGVGPWFHNSADSTKRAERSHLLTMEQLRWFDYWLKGVPNGIMEEAPIRFAVIIDSQRWGWRDAAAWPIETTEGLEYYFREGTTGTVGSINDGALSVDLPSSDGHDAVQVDFSATSGVNTRWTQRPYEDLAHNDAKGLTYTTPPLHEDVLVVGHPVVTLYASSTAPDGDFFVYLEEVDTLGVSLYVTEGVLRASHRAGHAPPFDNLGLPYHRSLEIDMEPLQAGTPVELVFDLFPTATVFDAGNRIRVTITGADAGNAAVTRHEPAPTITLYRSRERPSRIALPVARPDGVP